ncbi:MAG: site-specific integrase [Verrucomicrobia bacterium]|nr:site-specific integrase [Verrucomicrobiota bacterium]
MTNLGVGGDGKRRRQFFKTKIEAEQCLNEDARTTTDPLHGRRHEVMFSLERVDTFGVSLHEVVEFYRLHGAKKTNPLLTDSIRLFFEHKKLIGRGHNYFDRMTVVLRQLTEYVGDKAKVGDITTDQLQKFVYVEHGHTSNVTKVNLLTHLSVFFNFCTRHDLSSFNPVKKIERPSVKFSPPHVIRPETFSTLLHHCLTMGWAERLTLFVLVGFCGVRIEEASKLKWSDINFENKTVLVPAEVAKRHGFRMNKIPSNGMTWLEAVRDHRRSGRIIGDNWKTLVRSAISSSKIGYKKNCVRHSFCSYALASGWSLADVVAYMGHGGSPTMVFSHYRNVVSEEDGKRWFNIVP